MLAAAVGYVESLGSSAACLIFFAVWGTLTSSVLMGQGTAHARLREGLMGGSGHGNVSSSAPETGLASVFRLMGPLRGLGFHVQAEAQL